MYLLHVRHHRLVSQIVCGYVLAVPNRLIHLMRHEPANVISNGETHTEREFLLIHRTQLDMAVVQAFIVDEVFKVINGHDHPWIHVELLNPMLELSECNAS